MKRASESMAIKTAKVVDCMPPIKWVRTYYSADEGKLYREFETWRIEAADPSTQSPELSGLDWEGTVEPAMFR